MKLMPKILHLYWDLSSMSKLQTLTPITFHKLNPDWEIRLYVPKERDKGNDMYVPDYTGDDCFQQVVRLPYVKLIEIDPLKLGLNNNISGILKSDALRLQRLYEDGGVWSDFDVLWTKPFEDLKSMPRAGRAENKNIGAMVCRYNLTSGFHNVGVLFSRPGHPMIKMVLDEIEKLIESGEPLKHQAFGVDIWNSLFPTFLDVQSNTEFEDVVAFPYRTFYPISVFKLRDLFVSKINRDFLADAVCVHWFAGHKIAKEYMNSRYSHTYENTINSLIKRIL